MEWRTTRGNEPPLCHLTRTSASLRQIQNAPERNHAEAPTRLGLASTVKGWPRSYASAITYAPCASRLGGTSERSGRLDCWSRVMSSILFKKVWVALIKHNDGAGLHNLPHQYLELDHPRTSEFDASVYAFTCFGRYRRLSHGPCFAQHSLRQVSWVRQLHVRKQCFRLDMTDRCLQSAGGC